MKIAVFGLTGGNGRLVIAEGIRRGHEVTAFARDARALAGVTALAGVAEGDGRDRVAIEKAIAGQAAVIVTVSGRGEGSGIDNGRTAPIDPWVPLFHLCPPVRPFHGLPGVPALPDTRSVETE